MRALPPIADEFRHGDFPDERLKDRAVKLAAMLESDPQLSIPQAMGNRTQTEAAYRFFANERLDLQTVLSGHFESTAERADEAGCILAVHDTTTFVHSGEREDVGLDGILAHVCLGVALAPIPNPLGLLACDTWVRKKRKGKRTTAQRKKEGALESERWLAQSRAVESLVSRKTKVIHVEDREGDIFESMSARLSENSHFIIRATSKRVVLTEDGKENVMVGARKFDRVFSRRVQISAQKPRPDVAPKSRRERNAREAEVRIGAGTLRVRQPARGGSQSELSLNAVHVIETEAPAGHEPVEWLLFTDQPVASAEEIAFVLDAYRARWLIEEYFRALKTGCSYEERQLESADSLLVALGIFSILAWRLLALRHIERTAPRAPARTIASAEEIAVLQAKKRLRKNPSAAEFLAAVAQYGGHLKNNGPPGVLVLWRGLAAVQALAEGWRLAKSYGG